MFFNPFIPIILIIFAILAWKKQSWALWLIIFALPSYLIRFSVAGIPSTLLEGMILILFLTWIIKEKKYRFKKIIQEQKTNIAYPFRWEIIAILIISLMAVAISHWSSGALGIWKAYFFEPIIIYILAFNIFKEKTSKKIIYALAWSALCIATSAIIQKISGWGIDNPLWQAAETRRVVSFFGYPNAIGLFLAPLIPIFLTRGLTIWSRDKKSALLLLLVSLLSMLAIYFAKSEGAIIGLGASLFVIALFYHKITRYLALGLAILVLIFLAWHTPSYQLVKQKLSLQDLSGEIRQSQWQETWTMLNDGRIITGAGLDNYQETLVPYHVDGLFYNFDNDPDFHAQTVFNADYRASHWQPVEIYLYPHNILLNFWTELGLLGMLVFLWLILRVIYISIKIRQADNNCALSLGILGAMLVILIHGLVDVPYFKNDLAVIFWLIIVLSAYIQIKHQNGNNPTKIHRQ